MNLIKRLTLWISVCQRLEVYSLEIEKELMEGHNLRIKNRTIVVVVRQSNCRRNEQYHAMYQSFIRENSVDSILDNRTKNNGPFQRRLALQVPQVTISTLRELLLLESPHFRERVLLSHSTIDCLICSTNACLRIFGLTHMIEYILLTLFLLPFLLILQHQLGYLSYQSTGLTSFQTKVRSHAAQFVIIFNSRYDFVFLFLVVGFRFFH
jgi:hypothetical protein